MESSWVGEHGETWGEGQACPKLCALSPCLSWSTSLSYLDICELCPLTMNLRSSKENASLSSVSRSNKWIEPKKEVVGPSDLRPTGLKFGEPPGLSNGIWSWEETACGAESSTCGLRCCLHVVSKSSWTVGCPDGVQIILCCCREIIPSTHLKNGSQNLKSEMFLIARGKESLTCFINKAWRLREFQGWLKSSTAVTDTDSAPPSAHS